MKKLLLLALTICSVAAFAQDEGTIVKRERIERNKNIFVGGGISIPGGSNFGDYSTGINFEGGFSKRVNRVVSIGGSVSYLRFKYDAPISTAAPKVGDPNFFYILSNNGSAGIRVNATGADVAFVSLSGIFKFNFVPIKDNTPVSVYGFAKPFVSQLRRADLIGTSDYFEMPGSTGNNWTTSDPTETEVVEGTNEITGGVFVGPGIEFNPTKSVSFFLQASFGYTLKTDLVSLKSYPRDINQIQSIDEFPFITSGFTSINFAAGISFNLD
jgi:hypothetical protein